MKVNDKSNFFAGSVRFYVENWRKITCDPWIIDTIENGYFIEFEQYPRQNFPPKQISFNENQKELIDHEVLSMLGKGAIEKSRYEKDQYVSNIFLVQKKNGKYRPVINLKSLNRHVKYFHFKQETLSSVLANISRNDYFCSIDLSDAYFSISIHEECKKYLKFVWRGQLYSFTCLCFGLASSPRIFTKIMKVIFSHIRNIGVGSFFYIDDSLMHEQDRVKCAHNTEILRLLLKSLGFTINTEKSVINPTQRIVFLGYLIDSVQFKVFLTEEKIEKILGMSEKVLKSDFPSIREVSSLIGLYSSASCAVLLAPLFHRFLDNDKNEALSQNNEDYDKTMQISQKSRFEILWWIQNVQINSGKAISQGTPDFYLETDASLQGWGAVFHENSTQGRWTECESSYHINVLEILAMKFALLALCRDVKNTHICVKSDNSSAVQYINNFGGSVVDLHEIAKDIWLWAVENGNFLTAVHVAGKDNIAPDFLSRNFSDTSEWKLKETVFKQICLHFFYPNIDLFASRLNKQLTPYVTWFPDPDALASDAFSISWKNFLPYIFPPFSIIARILRKIEEEKVGKVLIIVPTWPSQPWFPRLLECLIETPVLLPFCQDLLRLVHSDQKHPLNMRKLFLVACVISGIPSKRRDFQDQLQISYLNHGESLPQDNMSILGGNGVFGVINRKLIPLKLLRFK